MYNLFGPSRCFTVAELISYKENRLPAAKSHGVEKHLMACEVCMEVMNSLDEIKDTEGLRQSIHALNQAISQRYRRQSRSILRQPVYYAIAAILLMGFLTIGLVLNRQSRNVALFAEFYEPYPSTIPTFRDAVLENDLQLAMSLYEDKNYPAALNRLESLVATATEKAPIHFYIGQIMLLTNKPAIAILNFQKVLEEHNSKLSEPAEWYLGLAYLKNSNIPQAKAIFKQIVSRDAKYKERSAAVLSNFH